MLLRAFSLATVLMISACAQVTKAPPPFSPPSQGVQATENVVNLTGLGEIRFGLKRSELVEHLNTDLPGCNTQLRAHPEGSLVFTQEDEFVLIWFNAPLRTPEGITTGSSVASARAAYPGASRLKAPADSHRFDGLLVSEGGTGYLLLHDGTTVQKAIAGYNEYLHRLFDSGFGVC
jgi:hypothetical protein